MKKRIVSLLICLAVAATTLLGMAWADLLPTGLFVRYAAVTGQQEQVSYVVGEGQTQVRSAECTILESSDTSIQLSEGWYAVKAGNFTINGDIKTTGDVHIVLCDYANLVVEGSFLTQGGGSVSIYAQTFDQVGQTGCMTVDSTQGSAFVRQSGDPDPAKLCIYGGKIQAKGSQRAMDKNYLVQVGDGTEKAYQTTPLRCTLVADETILPADQWIGQSDFDANNIYFQRCDHTQGMYLYTPTDSTHHIETCESCNYRPGGFEHIAVCSFAQHECILDANGNSTDRHTNECYCGNIGDPAESACVFSDDDYYWLDTKYHGHKCQDCLGISELQEHTFVDGTCTFCGEDCPHQVDENGKCTICGEQYEAVVIQDGDEDEYEYYYFADFTEALYACDGATLKLLADAAVDSGLALPEQSYICLDLNGKTLTVTPDEDGQAYLLLENNANLELTGSGAMQGELRLQDGGSLDTKETFTGSINAVTVDDRAFLNILSGHIGTLTLNYTQQSDSYISLLSLYGGTFDRIVSNYKDAQGDPLYDLPLSRLLKPGYALRYTADGKLAPVAEHGIGTGIFGVEAVRCTHDGSTADQCPYCGLTHVAEARGKKYYTLQDALDAVYSNGSEVTILDDIGIGAIPVLLSETSSNRITLDLNGHTVSDLAVGSTDFDHETREIFATGTGLAWITDSVGGGVLKNVSVYSGSLILDGAAIGDLYCYDQATINSGSVTKLTAGKLNASAPGARVVVEKVGAGDNMIPDAAWRVRDADSSLLLKWGFFDSFFIDNFGSVEIQKGIFNYIESYKDGNPYPLRSIIGSKSAFYTDPDGTGAFGKIYFLTNEAKLENVMLGDDHEHEFPNSTVACPCGLTCQHQVDDAGLCSLCGAKFEVYTQLADGTATYYDTIQTALRAGLQDGELVQLLADSALTSTAHITTPGTTPVTLDLNGKTLDATVYEGLFFRSGKLTIQDSLGGGSIFGDLRLSGTVTITGGQFSRVELKDAATSKLTLSGGTFVYLNCSGTAGTELLADGCAYYDNSANRWISQLHAGTKVEFINVTVKTCPHEGLDETTGLCGICGKTMLVKVTPAEGEPYYSESLHNDEMSAGEVKLLRSTTSPLTLYTSGTLDLNGHDLTAAIIEADGKFVLKNTAETAGSVNNFIIGAIYGPQLVRPGTLVIEDENIHIGTLSVVKNDGTQLTCGSFDHFIINTDHNPGLTVAGILAPNHTLQDTEGVFVKTSAMEIWSAVPMRVVAHTHSFPDSATDCPCGLHCDHDISDTTGLCSLCQTQFTTKVTHGETSVYYPGTLADAFDKAQNGDTVTLVSDDLVTTAVITDGRTLTLDFNGKTLVPNGVGIILGDSADATKSGHLILTGSGGTEELPNSYYQSIWMTGPSTLQTKNFTGYIGKLAVHGSDAGGQLSGGTYGIISRSGSGSGILGSFLAPGYAFQYTGENGAYLPYDTALEGIVDGNFILTEIENVQVVSCPHTEANEDTTLCVACHKAMTAKITRSDGTYYYVGEIGYGDMYNKEVKLLRDPGAVHFRGICTLDLNGKNMMNAFLGADGKFVLKNTGEAESYIQAFSIGANYGGEVLYPGTLVLENDNIVIDNLTVTKNNGTQLSCGSFYILSINEENNPDLTVADLLAPGHALVDKDGNFVNANVTAIDGGTDPIHIVPHEHSFANSVDPCACGYQCDHNIDEATGLCGSCGTQFNTKILRGENFIYYPGTLANVFDNAQSGDTIYLLVDGLAANASLGAGNTVTLNFNGKTLKTDNDGIILGGRWNAATWSTDDIGPGHLILSGSGGIQDPPYTSEQGILLYYGSTLSTDNFTGHIGKVGLDDVEKLSGQLDGGTYGLLYCNGYTNNTVGSFLKEGYAFQYTDETAAYLPYNTPLEGWPGVTHIWNVQVVKCPHAEIKNGACTYCDAHIVASIRGDSGEVYYSDFNTGLEDARMIGRTLKLYADYNYTTPIDLTGSVISIDLNGYTIAPADGVTAKLILSGADLTIQDSSENANGSFGPLEVVENGRLILLSGWLDSLTVPQDTEGLVSLRGGGLRGETNISTALLPLLKDGCYALDDQGAVVDITLPGQVKPNVAYTIAQAPASDTDVACFSYKVPLGRQNVPLGLSFAPVGEAAAYYTVSWHRVAADYPRLVATAMTEENGRLVYDTDYVDPNPDQPGFDGLKPGDRVAVVPVVTAWNAMDGILWQTWFQDSYGLSSYLEITNPNLKYADITLDRELIFQPDNFGQSSQGTELTQPITVTYFGQTLTEGTDYVVEGNTGVGAGDYTLTIRPAEGSDFLGENSAPWTIAKHTLGAVETPGHKEYDGTTDPVLDGSNFWSEVDPLRRINLVLGEDYEVVSITSGYESANAGSSSSSHSATIRLKNSNYIFANGTDTQTLTFTQAIIVGPLPASAVLTPGSLTVSNNHEKSYTFDLKTLLPTLPENMTFGSLLYELVDYKFYRPYEGQVDFTSLKALDLDSRYYTDGATVSADGILTLPINAVETDVEGSIGTVNVRVTSGNIKYFPLTVQLTAKNKQIPEGEPTFSATTIDYGQTLSDIEITGTMKVGDTVVPGTFTWNEPNLVLGASDWNVNWTFTPDNTDDYESVRGTVVITVNPVPVTVTAPKANTLTYTGEAQYLLTAGKAKGGWMVYSTELNGTYTYTLPMGTTAGSYTVWYKVEPDSNHTGTQPEPVTVTIAQAKAPAPTQGSLTVVNERAETLTLDLAKLLPTLTGNADFGTVTYGEPTVKLTKGYYTEGATVDAKGLLTLPVNAVNSTKEGEIGTVTVTVTTTNYEDITLTVNVNARNKGTPAGEPNFSTTTIDFGQKIGDIAISGTMQVGEMAIPGAFTWDTPDYAPNAGKCTVSWTFTPDDTDEYKVVHGTVTITVNKVPVTVTAPKANTLTYTGQAQTLLTAGSAVGGQMVYSLEKDGAYAATLPTKTDAGTYTVWYKVTADDNHIGTDPASVQVTISQATAPATAQGSLTVVNERAETLTFDLSKLLPTLAENCGFGAVTYGQPTVALKDGYYTNGATVNEKGLLTLPVNAVNSTDEGAVGTVTVTVTTTNYQAFTLTVNVSARNKGTPAGDPTLSAQIITYGQKVSDIKLSGTMQVGETEVPGTFTWDAPETAPNAGTYTAAWTFTPKDTDEYKVVHGTATIAVEKAEVTVTAPQANTLTYTGQPQTLLTAGTAQGGQMVYSTDLSGTYTAAIPTAPTRPATPCTTRFWATLTTRTPSLRASP